MTESHGRDSKTTGSRALQADLGWRWKPRSDALGEKVERVQRKRGVYEKPSGAQHRPASGDGGLSHGPQAGSLCQGLLVSPRGVV